MGTIASPVTLRPYQQRAIDAVKRAVRGGNRSVLIVAPTGSGKTVMGSALVRDTNARGNPVLWLAHRKELIDQTVASLARVGLEHVSVLRADDSRIDPTAPVIVASVQTLAAREDRPKASVVVFDECVACDTMVGAKRADDIVVGDMVPTPIGQMPVTHVWKRPAPQCLLVVKTERGRTLRCTENHPIWTSRGFVEASALAIGDTICGDDHGYDLPGLLSDVQRYTAKRRQPCEDGGASGSLPRVPKGTLSAHCLGDDGAHEQEVCKRSVDPQQPDGEPGEPCQDDRNASRDAAQAVCAGRQRARDDRAAARPSECSRRWLGGGSDCANRDEGQRGSVALQDRHRQPCHQDSDRDRWSVARLPSCSGGRRAQNGMVDGAWVDRVSSVERRSAGSLGVAHVYDFEVLGAHCYFAEGILSHNCHHYAAAEWGQVAADYATTVRVGLTATPERRDGTALGDLFSALVTAAQYSELIALGNILECDVVAPHERQEGSLAAAPWDAYDQQVATLPDASARHTVIFCSTVLQALECTQRIPGCRVVHGVMGDKERSEILAAFAAGEIPTIANCMVLTEGWDAPICDTAILARSCTSPSTYMQIAGRILRPNPADPHKSPLLIDLVGAIHEHGHPCEDREYSLTGRPISTSAQACVIWQCRGCGLCLPRPPSDRTCPRCQHVAPARECKVTPRHLEHIRWTCSECGQMGRVTPLVCPQCGAETSRAKRVASETDDKRHAYLVKLARDVAERGYKVGWMLFRYEAKYGERPSWDEVRRAQEEVGNAA